MNLALNIQHILKQYIKSQNKEHYLLIFFIIYETYMNEFLITICTYSHGILGAKCEAVK